MFQESLFHADELATFHFFRRNLEQSIDEKTSDPEEIKHVASILAHCAHTSRSELSEWLMYVDLGEIFDFHVLDTSTLHDGVLMENAAAHTLWLNGFFRDQMLGRHSVLWYDQLGSGFYARASLLRLEGHQGP